MKKLGKIIHLLDIKVQRCFGLLKISLTVAWPTQYPGRNPPRITEDPPRIAKDHRRPQNLTKN